MKIVTLLFKGLILIQCLAIIACGVYGIMAGSLAMVLMGIFVVILGGATALAVIFILP